MTITFHRKKNCNLAVLIDPDKTGLLQLPALVLLAEKVGIQFFFVGSSLLIENNFVATIEWLKLNSNIPVVIFPGSHLQLHPKADALLFLSLLSGRNAEYLIGQQVAAATQIKAAKISTIPTGYLLIDGGRSSTTSYITQTLPIPSDRVDVAVATAVAGELLGMQTIYLEAGSGAVQPVSAEIITAVKKNCSISVIVGGGIRSYEQAKKAAEAGADTIVVGNILETHPELLERISSGLR